MKLTSGTETYRGREGDAREQAGVRSPRAAARERTRHRAAPRRSPSRSGSSPGSATDQTLDKTKVESWIRGLTRINLSDPIGKEKKPEYGFEKPTATATLTMADGKETDDHRSAPSGRNEHDYYLTATGKEFVVTVASWNVTDQFQKKLKDLLPGGPDRTDRATRATTTASGARIDG